MRKCEPWELKLRTVWNWEPWEIQKHENLWTVKYWEPWKLETLGNWKPWEIEIENLENFKKLWTMRNWEPWEIEIENETLRTLRNW